MKMLHAILVLGGCLSASPGFAGADPRVSSRVDAEYPHLLELYQQLHAAPEISFQEVKTAARIAESG